MVELDFDRYPVQRQLLTGKFFSDCKRKFYKTISERIL